MSHLIILVLGVGIGYSVTQSTTEQLQVNNVDILRTEYMGNVVGYNMGWRYDRHVDQHSYELSLRFNPGEAGPRRLPPGGLFGIFW